MFFGTTFCDYPEDIAKALERANAYWRINKISETFYIKSQNTEAPLTESEKHRITTYLVIRGFPMKVVFEN